MGAVMCLSLGYVFGSLSPSAFLAKLKHINLRKEGSGNLGATNTLVVMGFRYGLFVLLFDLLKTIFANRLAKALFPQLYLAGLLAACGAVIGHIFPFYMKFQGGKGVACLAGMILTYDFGLFLFLLAIGITMMFVFDYGVIVPVSVAAVFPLFVLWKTQSFWAWLVTATVGLLIIERHRENFRKIKAGEEPRVRAYFGEKLRKNCLSDGNDETNQE